MGLIQGEQAALDDSTERLSIDLHRRMLNYYNENYHGPDAEDADLSPSVVEAANDLPDSEA